MKRERSWLVALTLAGAMVMGLSDTSSALHYDDGYSYTQPGVELVMPFDATDNDTIPPSPSRTTFLTVSNISGTQVNTHWTFWSESCDHLVDFWVCLTQNDTVVVDPRDTGAMGPDNERVGPDIDLSGERGIATVVAHHTSEDCTPSSSLADETIVGAFTFADIDVGYSFGNDAMALGEEGNEVQVPEPFPGNDFEFALQMFAPEAVETSVVVLTHLRESDGIVYPSSGTLRFATTFIDTTEIPTSLPDTTVRCAAFLCIDEDGTDVCDGNSIIPPATTIETSGIIRLQPQTGLTNGTDYVYGIVGQAVALFGASSSLKVEQVPGSASPAFIDGMENGL